RRGHVAQEEVGDAELEVELLLLRAGGDGEPLVEDVDALLEVPDLRSALGECLAEPGDHPALEILALDQKCAQIDQRFRHGETSGCGGRPLPRVGRSRESRPATCVPKSETIANNTGARQGRVTRRRGPSQCTARAGAGSVFG